MACAAGVLSHELVSVATAMCGFLMVALMWVLLAGHFATNVFLADICFDIRKYENDNKTVGIQARLDDRSVEMTSEWITATNNKSSADHNQYLIYDEWTHCPDFDNAYKTYRFVKTKLVDESVLLFNDNSNSSFGCSFCCPGGGTCSGSAGCRNLQACTQLKTDIERGWDAHVRSMADCRWIETVLTQKLANGEDNCDVPEGESCGGLCEGVLSGAIMVWSTSFVASFFFCCMSVAGIAGYSKMQDEGYY
jgi:hypothetical protein